MSKYPIRCTLQHFPSLIHRPIFVAVSNITRTTPFARLLSSDLPSNTHFLRKAAPLQTRLMSDDASYNAFLNKANEPVSSQSQTESTSQIRSTYDPTVSNASAPSSICSVLDTNPTYTSDTDSPFELVFFSYSGSKLPSAAEFKQCLHKSHSSTGEVEALSTSDFDPKGQYKSIINAVSQAGESGKGDTKVYRVEATSTRIEYYILTVAEGGSKLVGVVTKAVES